MPPDRNLLRRAGIGAARRIAEGLLAPCCAFCRAWGRDCWPVCVGCARDLPRAGAACPRCALPLPAAGIGPMLPCGRCQQQPPPYIEAHAPLRYAYPVDAALKALKFNADLAYAPAFAEQVLPWLSGREDRWDCLVPVPLHRWRQARRGYNQAEELARWMAGRSGLRMLHVAERRRRTRPQSELPATARRANVRGAFGVTTADLPPRLLLVDDVMTTGETCGELARVLLSAGAAEVGVLCIARAVPARRRGAYQAGATGSKV